ADAEQALRRSMARLPREIMRVPLAADGNAIPSAAASAVASAIVPSDDGRTVAVVTGETSIAVIDVATGRRTAAMTAPSRVLALAPTGPGAWLAAVADSAGPVRLIALPAGRETHRFANDSADEMVAIDGEHRHVLSVGRVAVVYDLMTGRGV